MVHDRAGPDWMSRAERAFIDGREIYHYDYDRREGVFAAL